ncbi:aldehyde dehydrogenase family protein [Pseudonocardia xishanensis]|uniref:aldehyde dehydrogenase family protein n=1 Tax=Pseudonocardia xishanensis TaxID=630995 RepID=UPI0031E89811
MSDHLMTIDGKSEAGTSGFDVENPATGEVFAVAPACGRDQLDWAMASAQAAQRDWARDQDARRSSLQRAAAAITASAGELAQLLTLEQGKPLVESTREAHAAAAWFGYYASLPTPVEVLQDGDGVRVTLHRVPLGVVAAVTPWNYPLLLASFKAAPGLLAGNTVVLKPSPLTPLSSLLLGRVLADVLPPGVLNVVTGPDSFGPQVTAHDIPRKISFTGSTATGRRVAAGAGLKRVTLELGGNDPAILLDDVDPSAVASKIFASAFANNGQTCAAVKRVYAPAAMVDAVAEALAAEAANKVVGPGSDPSTQLGPLTTAAQRAKVAQYVEDARGRGARVVHGGELPGGPGHFYPPTVVAGVPDEAPLAADEQFGPALPVLPYDTLEDAVARANAGEYGLGASVWGADLDRAEATAAQMEAGTVWVNTHTALSPRYPFAGHKSSGLGVENGVHGYEEFTDVQVRHVVTEGTV